AVVPNGAQTGPITIVAPAGTNTSATNFVVDNTSDLAVGVIGAPNPAFFGSNLTYTITATKGGPFVAGNVRLTNTLPASVILKSAVTTRGTLSTNSNPITGTLGNITNGTAVVITLTVVPNTPGTIVNTAKVMSDNPDPALANNTFSVTNTV